MAKTEIIGYETTPYGIEARDGQWFVRQMWWNKDISGPWPTREQANDDLVKTARACGSYKAIRAKVRA
jgi:hypothetical protein